MILSKSLTRREKVLLAILVALALVAAYFFAVYQPVSRSLAEIRADQEQADMNTLSLEALVANQARMQAELDEILAQPNAAETPMYNNLEKLIAVLNTTLAATTDYSLNFDPIQMPEEGDIVRRQLSMTFFSPSYDQAQSVILQLRESPYRCLLGDLSIAPIGSDGGTSRATGADLNAGAVQVNLSITFYERLG